MKSRIVNIKTNEEIAIEWDRIAKYRHKQLKDGIDLSFDQTLIPSIIQLSQGCNFSNVIDLGCGTGFLSNKLSDISISVIGIDISQISIEIANNEYGWKSNIKFIQCSIENIKKHIGSGNFTLAIANMVLMNVVNIEAVIKAINEFLLPGSNFIFTIVHPCYWPLYWKYSDENWFDYSKELFIEADFKISCDYNTRMKTTHIHRPLNLYVNLLSTNGFRIDKLIELKPKHSIKNNCDFKYPRFLAIKCSN